MDGRSIFIDDHSSGVPTMALCQSLQTDDSSIASGKLPSMTVKSLFANPDIPAMISGGIKRIGTVCFVTFVRVISLFFCFECGYGT
jgi:hypothetical protein